MHVRGDGAAFSVCQSRAGSPGNHRVAGRACFVGVCTRIGGPCYDRLVIDLVRLAAVPEPELTSSAELERGIAESAAYLDSDAALEALALDPYWPKWDSPWWHMLLLHELGETQRIPARTAAAVAAGLDRLLHIFPIHPGDAPDGYDPQRDVACHCALGTMLPILTARGVDVDRALPWAVPWFLRYQMADGGFNCDERAYSIADECPSSMVASIAPFEAMLGRAGSDEERAFVDRAARFLIERALERGSPTVHNAEEREAAPAWRQLCFPRFYFYDLLRGLAALVRWAEATGESLPRSAVAGAVNHLMARFPDGVAQVERRAHAGRQTIVLGQRGRREPASTFALLEAACVPGRPSAALTRQWAEARRGLLRLADAGCLVE